MRLPQFRCILIGLSLFGSTCLCEELLAMTLHDSQFLPQNLDLMLSLS